MRGRGIDLAQIQAPCKGCTDRQLHYHSSCEKYIAFEKESKDLRQKRLKAGDLKTLEQARAQSGMEKECAALKEYCLCK